MNLANTLNWSVVNDAVVAGATIDDDSTIVDMQNYEGVIFIVPITDSAATGVATLTLEQNSANSGTGMAALTGAVATATSAANDDLNGKLLIVDLYRPQKRYVRSNLASLTANIAYGQTIAIQYKGRHVPVTQLAAKVAALTTVASPTESS